MRGTQFFAAASVQEHPCHHLHSPIVTRRALHSTPASHFRALRALSLPTPPQRSEKAWIHEVFVARYLAAAQPNSILGEPPPTINPEETSLPRRDCVHLARLRCGHHPDLLSYECRLRPDTPSSCRWCGVREETLSHLFEECPALAAHRIAAGITVTRDLWDAPRSSLDFLRTSGVIRGP